MALRHCHYGLVKLLLEDEWAEGLLGPKTDVVQCLPSRPATAEEAAEEASEEGSVGCCGGFIKFLKADNGFRAFQVPIILIVIAGVQYGALTVGTILDLGHLWNGILTMLTVRSC